MKKTFLFLFFLVVFGVHSKTVVIDNPGPLDALFENALTEIGDSAGTIHIKSGNYTLQSTQIIPGHITIKGDGWGTCITQANPLDGGVPFFKTADGAYYVQIKDIKLMYEKRSKSYHIEGINSTNLKVLNVYCKGQDGSYFSGIRVWNGKFEKPYTKHNPDGTDSSFYPQATGYMTHIENCYIEPGTIKIIQSDSRILNNFIWSTGGSYWSELEASISICHTGNSLIQGNDIVPSKNKGGIYLCDVYNVRIVSNFFDGNQHKDLVTNWGVLSEGGNNMVISNNSFWQLSAGGIYLEDGRNIVVSGNNFKDNNALDKAYNVSSLTPYTTYKNEYPSDDIFINNITNDARGILITNNIFESSQFLTGVNDASDIRLNPTRAVGLSLNPQNKFVQITNNIAQNVKESTNHSFPGGYLGDRAFGFVESSILRNNTVNGEFIDEGQGQTIVSKGESYSYISIGKVTPFPLNANNYDIVLSPLDGSMNMPSFSIQDVTGAGFNIVFSAQLPEDAVVNWKWKK